MLTIVAEALIISIIVIPLYFFFKGLITIKMNSLENSRFKNQNFLIIIAHPDDEAMFFVPTIKELR